MWVNLILYKKNYWISIPWTSLISFLEKKLTHTSADLLLFINSSICYWLGRVGWERLPKYPSAFSPIQVVLLHYGYFVDKNLFVLPILCLFFLCIAMYHKICGSSLAIRPTKKDERVYNLIPQDFPFNLIYFPSFVLKCDIIAF